MFACPICTKLDRRRALCAECAAELWRKREPTIRDLGAYRTYGLFAWRRDDWLGLRWWAAALKKKEHPVFWRDVAAWLVDTFGAPAVGTTFVPVAGAARRNHARGLAEALSRVTGLNVADVLRSTTRSRGHQRRLSLFARRARRYVVTDEPPRGPIILVDDVITSGATVEAAFRALGQPTDFSAWCVMDRRPPRSSKPGPAPEGRDQSQLMELTGSVGGVDREDRRALGPRRQPTLQDLEPEVAFARDDQNDG